MTQQTPAHGIETIIIPRMADLGNFEVMRALPSRERQMVGPFIFWDQMGPGEFKTAQGLDVRPHPHIGLATVTYLFKGSLDHRDSLGFHQRITPGDVNLMTAGSGIAHSERTGQDVREHPSSLFGIQSWLALPQKWEESDASFVHHGTADLPTLVDEGKSIKLIAGTLYGMTSPVVTHSTTLYADIHLKTGSHLPIPKECEERALYLLSGSIEIGGVSYPAGQLLVLRPGDEITIKALGDTRLMLLGGETADGPRHIWWNFVSSRTDRIEQAKEDWLQGRFKPVVGDSEFIPLPSKR